MLGLVIKSTGSQYLVKLDDGRKILCRIRGNLRLQGFEATNPITVGDKVEVETSNVEGMITELIQRKNYIIRKSVKLSRQIQVIAANIDRAFVVATPLLPRTSLGFIDRFLATAEAYSIPAGIVFNKSDLYDDDLWNYVNDLMKMYEKIGYKTFAVSAIQENSLKELETELKNKVTLFSGHSGVGKSTLINTLVPGLSLKTAKISKQHLKGTHTTTFAEMHSLPNPSEGGASEIPPLGGWGGYIIDTPGIREFGTIDFDKFEVSHFFPEIFKTARNCKFNNCLHVNEKDCAVLDALEKGELPLSRFESYLSILGNEDIYR